MTDEMEHAEAETPLEPDGGEREPVRRPVLQGTKGIDTAQVWISGFLIVVVGVIAFSNVLPIPWQGEDADLIASNAPLHALRTFPEAVDPDNPRALTMLTFALNWWLTPGSSGAFHAVNVLLHLANAVLVFLLCRALFGKAVSPVVAMLAGMLFVVHPLASESVDYVVGRAGLLATFFVLISLNAFVRGTEDTGSAWSIVLSVLAFVLAVAADSSAWVLPLLVLVMDRMLRGKFGVMNHLGLHAVYWGALIAFWAIDFARPDLSANAGAGRLALMTVAPAGLSVVHPASDFNLAGFLVVAIAFAGVPLVLYRSVAGLSLFWFGLALLTGAPNERGAYLALAGAVLLAPWLLSRARPQPVRVAAGFIAAVAVLACGVTTYRRGLMWQNSIELWTDAAKKAPDSPVPPRNLGRAFLRLTNTGNARELTATAGAQAEEQFRRAMALGCDEPDVIAGLGEALAKQGKTDEALAVYQDALRKDPVNRDWTLHAANLLLRRANTGGGEDDLLTAVEYFAKANRAAPLTGSALAGYGTALYSVGDFEAAASLLAGVVGDADEESQPAAMLKHAKGMAAQIKRMEEETVKLLQADPKDATALKMRA
ncbi:MAG: tetratricopeptide repeat protein, partial [Nitrospiraceae bacterium]|nr:tetratricopeptide repeat protein [Nitrospiraceae bacterium]